MNFFRRLIAAIAAFFRPRVTTATPLSNKRQRRTPGGPYGDGYDNWRIQRAIAKRHRKNEQRKADFAWGRNAHKHQPPRTLNTY